MSALRFVDISPDTCSKTVSRRLLLSFVLDPAGLVVRVERMRTIRS